MLNRGVRGAVVIMRHLRQEAVITEVADIVVVDDKI
jgi:hypothetical protein